MKIKDAIKQGIKSLEKEGNVEAALGLAQVLDMMSAVRRELGTFVDEL